MSTRFSAQFPFQGFNQDQGSDSSEEESDEDDYNQLPGLFRQSDARSIVERGVAKLRRGLSDGGSWCAGALPEHHRLVMWALSEAATLNPIEFSEASDHDLIPPEFYAMESTDGDFEDRNAAHVYGELTLDGVDQLLDVFAKYTPSMPSAGSQRGKKRTPAATADSRFDNAVFVDLGSGLGKIVLQLALDVRCSKAAAFVGVELAQSRHDVAVAGRAALGAIGAGGGPGSSSCAKGDASSDVLRQSMANAIRGADVHASGTTRFIRGDITRPLYRDATHVFANSLLFPAMLSERTCRELSQCPKLRVVVSSRALPLPESIFRVAAYVPLAVSWQNELFPMAVYVRDSLGSPRRWMADSMSSAMAHYGGDASLCRRERLPAPSAAERAALIASGAIESDIGGESASGSAHVLDASGASSLFLFRSGGQPALPCHEPRGFWLQDDQ